MTATARQLGGRLLDLLLPPRCYACGEAVLRQGELCAACWSGLHFITEPCCSRCGFPFEFGLDGDSLCAACHGRPPVYEQARAALRYDDASRTLLLAFKHGDRTELAAPFARMMAQGGRALLASTDLIVPIPLHWTRLLKRRYNQSALLAKALSRQSGAPWAPRLLHRVRRTSSQGGLDRSARLRNVRGAFRVSRRIDGGTLLLVDDVHTTGATLEAAGRALLKAGADRVLALSVARVVTAAQIPI